MLLGVPSITSYVGGVGDMIEHKKEGSVTQKYFHLPDSVCAPVQQGDVVGTVELKLAGETIGVVDLIAGQDVSRNPLLFTVARFQEFLGSLYLKVVITLSIISKIGRASCRERV